LEVCQEENQEEQLAVMDGLEGLGNLVGMLVQECDYLKELVQQKLKGLRQWMRKVLGSDVWELMDENLI
jgi:hypothetical protein